MIMTVLGNSLVITSYKTNRQLQSINNMFLVSLACADLVIGVVSMTLYPIYMITRKWFLGPVLCDIWLCIDYTLSMASVCNLMLICLDRYFSITRPFTYRAKRTECRAKIYIAIAWIFSFLLWSPAIITWHSLHPRSVENESCQIQFLDENKTLTLITAVLAFFLPLLIMAILYGLIYQQSRKCSQYLEYLRGFRKQRSSLPSSPFVSLRRSLHRISASNASPRPRSNSYKDNRRRLLSLDNDSLSRIRLNSFTSLRMNPSPSPLLDTHNKCPPQNLSPLLGNHVIVGNENNRSNTRVSCPQRSGGHMKQKSTSEGLVDFFSVSENACRKESKSQLSPSEANRSLRVKLSSSGDDGAADSGAVNGLDSSHCFLNEKSTEHDLSPKQKTRECFGGNKNGRLSSRSEIVDDAEKNRRKSSNPVKLPSSERKAGRTLSAILLAFVCTWLPYNICVVYKTFCYNHQCVPDFVWDVAYYLCYVNSTVNPFCFALCNKTFRDTFKNILMCKSRQKKHFASKKSTHRARNSERPTIVRPTASSTSSS